jgi:hypothetical protein
LPLGNILVKQRFGSEKNAKTLAERDEFELARDQLSSLRKGPRRWVKVLAFFASRRSFRKTDANGDPISPISPFFWLIYIPLRAMYSSSIDNSAIKENRLWLPNLLKIPG